jgi:hypothetical protein
MLYQDQRQLVEVVARYIRAGLEDGEYCVWILGAPVSHMEALEALERLLVTTDLYLEQGQLELVSYTDWYLPGGRFDPQRVIHEGLARYNYSRSMRFAGMRVTGNPMWLVSLEQWAQFSQYEQQVHEAIKNDRILALCTYAGAHCNGNNLLQVLDTHGYALHQPATSDWALTPLKV